MARDWKWIIINHPPRTRVPEKELPDGLSPENGEFFELLNPEYFQSA